MDLNSKNSLYESKYGSNLSSMKQSKSNSFDKLDVKIIAKYNFLIIKLFRIIRLEDISDSFRVSQIRQACQLAFNGTDDINVEKLIIRLKFFENEQKVNKNKNNLKEFNELMETLFRAQIFTLKQKNNFIVPEEDNNKKKEQNEQKKVDVELDKFDCILVPYLDDEMSSNLKLKARDDIILKLKSFNLENTFPQIKFKFEDYGSQVNSTNFKSSDIDLTIITNFRISSRSLLESILKSLQELKESSMSLEPILMAKIPLIDVIKRYQGLNIVIGITVNNVLGVENSKLLNLYQGLDTRIKKLCLLVKLWGKIRGTAGGRRQLLTSYAYNLMVIFYLQRIVRPPILPSLQKLVTEPEFSAFKKPLTVIEIRNTKFSTDLSYVSDINKIKKYMEDKMVKNTQSTCDLLKGFFKFYSDRYLYEDFETISIKEADFKIRNKEEENYVFSIEDPFDLSHNPGEKIKETDSLKKDKIMQEMKLAFEKLEKNNIDEVFQEDDKKFIAPKSNLQNAQTFISETVESLKKKTFLNTN